MMIVNQDPEQLDALLKSGRTMSIEGRLVQGADYLTIDKIDGQPYTVKESAAAKTNK